MQTKQKLLLVALAGIAVIAAAVAGNAAWRRHQEQLAEQKAADAYIHHRDGGSWVQLAGDSSAGVYVYKLASNVNPDLESERVSLASTFTQPQRDGAGHQIRTIYKAYRVNCMEGRAGVAHGADVEMAVDVGLDAFKNGLPSIFSMSPIPLAWDSPIWSTDRALVLRAAQTYCRA